MRKGRCSPRTGAVARYEGEPVSKQQQLDLIAILRQGGVDLGADVATMRAQLNDLMARVPVAGDVEHVPTTIGGVNALDVSVQGVDTANTILYFHGGVYVIGAAAQTVPLVSDIARRAQTKAVTVDYRLGPEHPYPAAVDDARAAYEGLLAQGLDAGQIALAGESAGGGLAVALLLALRDGGIPLPSSAFLMSPYADLTLSGESLLENQAIDPILTPEGLRLRVPDYVGDADPSEPQISPIFGNLRGLPPLLIQVGSHEILLSDALRLAGHAATDEVQVTLEVTPGVPHVFQGFAAMLDEGDAALDRAAAFLTTQFSARQPA
jgi:acetyl esterase/lipase